MKNILLLCTAILISASMGAQSTERQLVGSANGLVIDADLYLEWSLGEPITGLTQANLVLLSEGFIQPDLDKETTSPNGKAKFNAKKANHSLSVYPNPFDDFVSLAWKTDRETPTNLQILNLTGEVIYNDTFSGGVQRQKLNLSGYPAGVYFIQLTSHDGELLGNSKILKIK